jgi:hypothetical protein
MPAATATDATCASATLTPLINTRPGRVCFVFVYVCVDLSEHIEDHACPMHALRCVDTETSGSSTLVVRRNEPDKGKAQKKLKRLAQPLSLVWQRTHKPPAAVCHGTGVQLPCLYMCI